jgi:hypothetical protein
MTAPKLTEAQRTLLARGLTDYIHYADVRTAKRLASMGLVTLEDNGYVRGNNERWLATITDAGRAALRGDK